MQITILLIKRNYLGRKTLLKQKLAIKDKINIKK